MSNKRMGKRNRKTPPIKLNYVIDTIATTVAIFALIVSLTSLRLNEIVSINSSALTLNKVYFSFDTNSEFQMAFPVSRPDDGHLPIRTIRNFKTSLVVPIESGQVIDAKWYTVFDFDENNEPVIFNPQLKESGSGVSDEDVGIETAVPILSNKKELFFEGNMVFQNEQYSLTENSAYYYLLLTDVNGNHYLFGFRFWYYMKPAENIREYIDIQIDQFESADTVFNKNFEPGTAAAMRYKQRLDGLSAFRKYLEETGITIKN